MPSDVQLSFPIFYIHNCVTKPQQRLPETHRFKEEQDFCLVLFQFWLTEFLHCFLLELKLN